MEQKVSISKKFLMAFGSRPFFIIQAVIILAAFSQLLTSDAYYVAYLFVLIPALLCLAGNYKKMTEPERVAGRLDSFLSGTLALLFACMVTFANYSLWDLGDADEIILFLLLFIGSFFAFENILYWIVLHKDSISWKRTRRSRPLMAFFLSFDIIAGLHLCILFLCKYPGNLTTDSIGQMQQLLSNVYSNHQPFYHTLTVKIFISIGTRLFHDINTGVALYSAFSVLIMAAAFAFSAATVEELRAPKWMITLMVLFYALMPYHIMYSMTVWKDVFFGAFILLFGVFFFRCIKRMSLKPFNYIGLVVSGLGICLYRSNGFFVFVLTTLIFFILWKLKNKRILFLMVAVLACSFVLKHPVLDALHVTQPDLIESLSIPSQQIARDVTENGDFSKEDRALLSKVVDVKKIPATYKNYISDPIKNLVRAKNNQEYIRTHAEEFLNLYLHRMEMHPFTYLKGWIDETRGYWNAGYNYWRWRDEVRENDLGIIRTVNDEKFNAFVNRYLTHFENWPCLQIFLCIGFFDWLMLITFFISVIRRDKAGVMLSVPMIMTVLSLLVATPVFAEFRYDYAVFCTLPVALALALRPHDPVHEKKPVKDKIAAESTDN